MLELYVHNSSYKVKVYVFIFAEAVSVIKICTGTKEIFYQHPRGAVNISNIHHNKIRLN